MSIRRMMMMQKADVGYTEYSLVENLPVGSKLKMSNGMQFCLNCFRNENAFFTSKFVLEKAPWATGGGAIRRI